VIVNPQRTTGWLEEETMGSARDLLLRRVAEADRHGRFRVYYPVNEAGEPVYVHAKVAVIDDRLLRVGSSNLNNRSLGFDSECDLAVEADPGRPEIAATITGIRDDLLGEHLGVPVTALGDAVRRQGGLGAAIESLRRPHGRSLRPLSPGHVNPVEAAIVESRLADPERPDDPESRLAHLAKRAALRVPPPVWLGLAAGLLAGAAATFAAGRAGRRGEDRAEDEA
jgi:phospholipase D1/2